MLKNLKAEMIKHDVSNKDLVNALNIKSEKTLNNKISCRTEFTRNEIYIISTKFFPDIDMKYLFEIFPKKEIH